MVRRDTSADSAARFVGARRRKHRAITIWRCSLCRGAGHNRKRCPSRPTRITLDFAEPTLRLIHDVLLDATHTNVEFSDRGALLMIAEQMVAIALGEPPCDDPPLTDREVR